MRFAAELLNPVLVSPQIFDEATRVQFPRLNGIVPGYGMFKPNDWGLGFELRGEKNPHWTGTGNSPRTFGHFGQSGTFLWVDPEIDTACVILTNRAFGEWAKHCGPSSMTPYWGKSQEPLPFASETGATPAHYRIAALHRLCEEVVGEDVLV